jgi:hypothetical protein
MLDVDAIPFFLIFWRTAMTTLMINDLLMTEQLDLAQMSSIHGGMIKQPRVEPIGGDQPEGPAGANVPVIWNSGVDGPIIIRPR